MCERQREKKREMEREREYHLNTRTGDRADARSQELHLVSYTGRLAPSAVAFSAHQQGAGMEVEEIELKLALQYGLPAL